MRVTDAPGPAASHPLAIGWATVELDRAARELGGTFVDAAPSIALGAHCRIAGAPGPAGSPRVVLLEPSTEGKLAGWLARHGEGWAVEWTATLGSATGGSAATTPGPLGPERLHPGRSSGDGFRLEVAGYHRAMSDPALTIRPATAADAEAIATLFTDEGYPAGPSDISERLTRFASPHSQVAVAERDGAVLGFVAYHAMPRFEHDDRIVRVLALVVDAGARERGVGRTLLAEAERAATELGAAFIEITAGHHRPEARQLYESVGYDATVAAYLRKKL